MRRIFILCLLVVTPAFVYGQAADVKKVLAAYDKAWTRKDVAAVSPLLAANYTYFTSTGELTDRKSTLEFLASPEYKLTFSERSEIVALHADKNLVIVASRWKGRGTFGAEPVDDDQRCGLVFLKSKSGWQIVSEHCVNLKK